MELTDIIREIETGPRAGELSKIRMACAQCGTTWVEMRGLIVLQKKGSEDTCLHIGMEAEDCQTCRSRSLDCPECGSKNVYEISFAERGANTAQLSYTDIRQVSWK